MKVSKTKIILECKVIQKLIGRFLNAIFLSSVITQLVYAMDSDLEQKTKYRGTSQRQRIKKKFTPQKTPLAPIGISSRLDGKGKGAFYDHYTVQLSTEHETQLVKSPNVGSNLHVFAKSQTFNLPYGTENERINKKLPRTVEGWDEDGGLLFIPGYARNDADQERERFEQEIIRKAMLKGRPILAVCAGSWRLWEAYGGIMKEVRDHNYNGGMLRLNGEGTVTYNIPVHSIRTLPDTLLNSIMDVTLEEETIAVNSVHWLAPNDTVPAALPGDINRHRHVQALYSLLQVSARATEDEDISLMTRQREKMAPEEDTVEAFETKWGAPTLGIQWHPEAYCRYKKGDTNVHHPQHKNILEFMAKAGDAYAARRRMLKELTDKLNIKE